MEHVLNLVSEKFYRKKECRGSKMSHGPGKGKRALEAAGSEKTA